MVKCLIIIENLKDEYTENDYMWISKNFKVINILYCAFTVDIYEFISHCDSVKEIWETLYYLDGTNQNLLLRNFVAEDEMNMDGKVKEVEDHQLYEEQEYESGDPIQGVIHNNIKHVRIEELLENECLEGKKVLHFLLVTRLLKWRPILLLVLDLVSLLPLRK